MKYAFVQRHESIKKWGVLLKIFIAGARCGTSGIGCPLKVVRVPKNDGSSEEIETAGSIALLLETAIPYIPESIEKYRACQSIARLPIDWRRMNAPTQIDALQPVQKEQRPLDPSEFTQCGRQSVLAWIAAELCDHERRGDDTLLD